MQPQMPYGAPQGSYPPQPGQGPQGAQPQQPYPPQPGQAGYPYPNQQPAPYGGVPGTQPQYPQGQMPQYQPPVGQQRPGRPAPLPPPPPAAKTPYDFFMQQKHPKNTKGIFPGPKQAGLRGKIVWIAAAAVAVMMIAILVNAFTPKDTSIQGLITLAQTQQEIARVCDQGYAKATVPATRSIAINCSTSILSDQAKLLSYLSTQHTTVKSKQLGALASATTDSALKAAASSSNFDDTFTAINTKQLTAYANSIQQQLASGALGANAQALLNDELAHVKILIGV